jgi:hypothetical protein
MPRGQPSSRKREAAISALLCTGTIAAAAEKARVSERTLRLWLKEPSFCASYRAARAQLLEHSLGVLQGAAGCCCCSTTSTRARQRTGGAG